MVESYLLVLLLMLSPSGGGYWKLAVVHLMRGKGVLRGIYVHVDKELRRILSMENDKFSRYKISFHTLTGRSV